ncbi:MAG: hypothetical protein J0L60_00995 [Ignavibacteria bacterium]|nr:hypothetical protein [Ignavibacteria bacterium]
MSRLLSGLMCLILLQFGLLAQNGYKELLLEGDKLLNKRPPDVLNARMKYLEALNKEKNDPEVYIKIAITFIYAKDERSANMNLDQGLKLFKEGKSNMKAILTYYKGMVKEFVPPDTKDTNKIKKHFSEAIRYYLESLDYLEVPVFRWNDFDFSKVNIYNDVGRVSMMINDAENGKKYFQLCLDAIGADKDNKYYTISHFGLAQIYKFVGILDSSVHHFNKVLEVDPKNINALSELYGMYFDAGDYDKGFIVVNRIDSMMSVTYDALMKRKDAPKDSIQYIANIIYNTKMEKGHLKFNSKSYEESLNFYAEAYKYKKNKKLIELLKKMTILNELSKNGWMPVVKDAQFIKHGNEYFFYSPAELKTNPDSSVTATIKSVVTADVDLNMLNVFQSEFDQTAPDNIDKVLKSKYGQNEYNWTFVCGKNDFVQNFEKKFDPTGKDVSKPNSSKPVNKTATSDSFELDILKFLCRAAGK